MDVPLITVNPITRKEYVMTWYNKWIWFGFSLVPAVVMVVVYLGFGAVRPPLKFDAAEATESFWNPASWGAIEAQQVARDAATESFFTATAYSFGLSKTTLGWSTLGFGLAGMFAAGTILAGAKSYVATTPAPEAKPAATPGAGISFKVATPEPEEGEAPVVVVATPVVKKKVIGRPKGATNKKAPAWVATPPKQKSPAWVTPKQKPPMVEVPQPG